MDSMGPGGFDPERIGAQGTADSQRARRRESFFLMARVLIDGERVARDVRVRNLSEGGLMMEMPRPLDVGLGLTLHLRGIGEIRGKVAWYAEGRAGVALEHPIDPAQARKPVGQGGRTPNYAKPLV
jgi:hypothetical protein